MMFDDDLDRILSPDDGVVPSSGFVSTVMDSVRREASTPPPIPFPWKRALPGLIAAVITLVTFVMGLSTALTANGAGMRSASSMLVEAFARVGAGWLLLALLITLVSVKLSMRFASVRA
jgi:di/tricarboxylate transporter